MKGPWGRLFLDAGFIKKFGDSMVARDLPKAAVNAILFFEGNRDVDC